MMRTMLRHLRRDMKYFYSPSFNHHTSNDVTTLHAARYYNKRGSWLSRVSKLCVFVTNNGEADGAPIRGPFVAVFDEATFVCLAANGAAALLDKQCCSMTSCLLHGVLTKLANGAKQHPTAVVGGVSPLFFEPMTA